MFSCIDFNFKTLALGLLSGIIYLIFNQNNCAHINCGEFGHCLDGNCQCNDGFIDQNYFCFETCAFEPCKKMN